MIKVKDYEELRRNAISLPPDTRFALLEGLMRTFHPGQQTQRPHHKTNVSQDSYAEMVGLLATDQSLSDEDIDRILLEEKLKKYGLEEYL